MMPYKRYGANDNVVGRWLAAAEEINGYMILKNAYNEKEQLRFATISVQSPKEYDLKVK